MRKSKQLFIKFLKDNNAYEQYMANFKIHRIKNKELVNSNKFTPKEFFNNTLYGDFFAYAFFWKDTSQGYDYWNKLDGKWWREIMIYSMLSGGVLE